MRPISGPSAAARTDFQFQQLLTKIKIIIDLGLGYFKRSSGPSVAARIG